MAQRINVAVSNELHQRLQVVKEEIGNVSAIFQEALLPKIEFAEALKKAKNNRDKAIARLRQEKEEADSESFSCGKMEGLKDAENLEYQVFIELEQIEENKDEYIRYDQWVDLDLLPDTLKDSFSEFFSEPENKSYYNQQKYLAGWFDGVMEFWNDVKKEI